MFSLKKAKNVTPAVAAVGAQKNAARVIALKVSISMGNSDEDSSDNDDDIKKSRSKLLRDAIKADPTCVNTFLRNAKRRFAYRRSKVALVVNKAEFVYVYVLYAQ